MKLATYQDGSRDGLLVVVSRDLSLAHHASGIATRLQQVLDDWNFLSPQLQDLSVTLNQGKARHAFPFDPRQCMAPLPRAYQWAVADQARLPPDSGTAPLLVQGGSDAFLGPCQEAWFGSAKWGIDAEAGLAAVTGDVAMGANAAQGLDGVRLLLLAQGWRLRQLASGDGAKDGAQDGDALHSRPAAAFGPVAVTPDELGDAWSGGRVQGTLQAAVNGKTMGVNATGPAMAFHFGELVAHLGKTRHVRAGSIVGTGPLGSRAGDQGWGCIAERRAAELADRGAAATPYFAIGDLVRLDLLGGDGQSVFGAIAQRVAGPQVLEADADAGTTNGPGT